MAERPQTLNYEIRREPKKLLRWVGVVGLVVCGIGLLATIAMLLYWTYVTITLGGR
jgi:hypothetical protein